jgi:hypothetical protein
VDNICAGFKNGINLFAQASKIGRKDGWGDQKFSHITPEVNSGVTMRDFGIGCKYFAGERGLSFKKSAKEKRPAVSRWPFPDWQLATD